MECLPIFLLGINDGKDEGEEKYKPQERGTEQPGRKETMEKNKIPEDTGEG